MIKQLTLPSRSHSACSPPPPTAASAGTVTGYVCQAMYSPTASAGVNQSILMAVFAGPDCTLEFKGYYRLCGAGSPESTVCNVTYTYDLSIMFPIVVRALERNIKVTVASDGASPPRTTGIFFYAS